MKIFSNWILKMLIEFKTCSPDSYKCSRNLEKCLYNSKIYVRDLKKYSYDRKLCSCVL